MMTEEKEDLVMWFEDLKKTDIPSVGGKNANLGEMINAGIPIPPGFAVTAYSYKKLIEETGISEKIYGIINERVTDPNDPRQYEKASKEIPLVEVVEKLEEMAAEKPQELNWKVSIVDLLKLLDIDSSFEARKELAIELRCPDEMMEDSAQMNTWLHKTVLEKIAENGGNIPMELLD